MRERSSEKKGGQSVKNEGRGRGGIEAVGYKQYIEGGDPLRGHRE